MLLSATGITKRFPGVAALMNVDLSLEPGQVHCLLGENGAGKSTLIKILSGALQPDEGTIRFDGHEVVLRTPYSSLRTGISTIFQESNLVPELSVAENILLGREPKRPYLPLLDRTAMRALAGQAMELVQERIDPSVKARDLSPSQHQMVEIAKALSRDARVVILDEPTAALTERETERLFSVIRRLASQGTAFIYISHRLEEIFRVGDMITVLRDGRVTGTVAAKETDERSLVRMMVGRDVEFSGGASSATTDPVLVVTAVSTDRIRDCSLTLHRGEVLGVAGLAGSGRTELARCLFGVDRLTGGSMTLLEKPYAPASPREAIERGVGLLTEDRNKLGLFLQRSVLDNITLPRLREFTRFGLLRTTAERSEGSTLASRFGVKAPSLDASVSTLSGGNRQKVLLSRVMGGAPKVLMFDEPTAGIDVGAKADIHAHIRRLAAEGAGIIVISSELPELLALADRVLVMRGGTVAGEGPIARTSEEQILHLATGTE